MIVENDRPITLIDEPGRDVVGQPQGAMTSPADLLRLAVTKGADVDQLERLMALQMRWEAENARKAFVAAMAAFKAEPLVIFKRKAVGYTTNDGEFVGYKHAELSDVTAVVVPAMSKHGLSHRWNIRQEGGDIAVDCIVTHVAGHSETVTMTGKADTSGKKNPIQAQASTVQYLQRYTLLAATGMSTKGEDDDGRGGDKEDPDQELIDAFREASTRGTAALKTHYDQHTPSEEFWKKHGPALRKAAAQFDADEKAAAKTTKGAKA